MSRPLTITEELVKDVEEDILFYRCDNPKLEWAKAVGCRITDEHIAAMKRSGERNPVRMAAKMAIASSIVKAKMRSIPPRGSSRENSMHLRIANWMNDMTVTPFYA
ncbi:MAG: hypothetical protein JWO82_3759 [Akkermansiaceae bacterium]|nr:hypothetical protein [Akkermansiaceae bacterium]